MELVGRVIVLDVGVVIVTAVSVTVAHLVLIDPCVYW